jgi:hypothetical protein
MVTMPTRSRVESWRFDHLEQAATQWRGQADRTEAAFDKAVQSIGSAPWEGTSAGAARDLVFNQLVAVRGAADSLRQAAQIAGNGATTLASDKSVTLAAIRNAEQQFFSVSEELKVTDRIPPIFSIPLSVLRHAQASQLQADIQADALRLAADDERIAATLKPFSEALRDFTLGGPSGPGSPTAAPGDPKITGPAGPLTYEQDQSDLNATLPGSDVVISGDGRTGYPTLNGERNPLDVGNPPGKDEVRPLPTGTIVGPDGKQYAMYGEVPYDRKPEEGYAVPDTTVVDLSDPSKSIGVLPGISQASGAYDAKTNRMVIVGNPDPHSGTRMLYTSDPIDPANPNAWVNTVRPVGEIKGLPGNRESQVVALKGGGFMVVGSSDVVPGGNQQPITAVTASTPEGLLNATPSNLFPPGPQQNWPGGAPPYGPTVVDTTYDPVAGVEQVHLRVSTWEVPPGWVPTPDQPDVPYNPKTYTTNVSVQH